MKKTYVAEIKCHNCKFMLTYTNLPFGIPIDKYLYDKECMNCGNYIIKRKNKI